MEHHDLWNEYENDIFNSPGSFYNFYPNFLKLHKMSKNKAFTWNEHHLRSQNGNSEVK